MMGKSALKLNVKYVAPFLHSIPVIVNLKLNFSALIVNLLSTYGNIVKMSPSINVLTIIALYILKINLNLIFVKNY